MKLLSLLFLFSLTTIHTEKSTSIIPTDLKSKAKSALDYCNAHAFNTQYCFLVDMSIHSGKKRFFFWDFKEQRITDSGLVAHGCGKASWSADETKLNPVFSNVSESHCSSLGKYKIGNRGYSSWGINVNYKLHGLDQSNSNAYKRIIVLHSWNAVSDTEPYPNGTAEGWGCPAVSNKKMEKIDKFLKASDKPVLLWIYN